MPRRGSGSGSSPGSGYTAPARRHWPRGPLRATLRPEAPRPVSPRPPPRHPKLARFGARLGFLASALIVFMSGYAAMRSNDWRVVTVITLVGGLAGLVAAGLAQRNR
jgi:hypothetical protein